jgi:hypothetical protein
MKTTTLLTLTTLLAAPLWAAEPAEELKAAAKKLAGQSYSWTSKSDFGQPAGEQAQGRGRGIGSGSVSGKTEKDGFTLLTFTMGENTSEAVLKGDKVAIKTGEEWKSGEELTADGGGGNAPNRGRFMAMRVQRTKLPAAEVQEMAGSLKELKKDGDTYTGALSADAIKQVFSFGGGRRPGADNNAPAGLDTSGLKGSAKFWLKDGAVTKYETKVEGKMTFRDNEREVSRTTTIEIKDVGTTKVEVPADAKKKFKD